jgi:tripartite-type tricarboxylate transporter receptor subunit TctC
LDSVWTALADGYTVASATVGTLSINQFLFPKMPYDAANDFEYVSMIWENCNVFVVSEKHPAKALYRQLRHS